MDLAARAEREMTSRFPVADKRSRFLDGILFDSKKERDRYAELKLLDRAGEISALGVHPRFLVDINGKRFCVYTPDFYYWDKRTKEIVYEEVKSTGTRKDAAYRLRRKAAELFYDIKVTEVIR